MVGGRELEAGDVVRLVRRTMCARRRAQCSPPCVAAFGTAACWAWCGSEAALNCLVVHATAVVRVRERACGRAPRATPMSNRPTHASVVLCSAAVVRLCRSAIDDGGRNGHAPRWPWRPPAPAGANRADASDDCLWASGGGLRVGGWNCGMHLDRGDLLYERKQARIVRRAVLVVVPAAGAIGGHDCVGLRLAARVHNEAEHCSGAGGTLPLPSSPRSYR